MSKVSVKELMFPGWNSLREDYDERSVFRDEFGQTYIFGAFSANEILLKDPNTGEYKAKLNANRKIVPIRNTFQAEF